MLNHEKKIIQENCYHLRNLTFKMQEHPLELESSLAFLNKTSKNITYFLYDGELKEANASIAHQHVQHFFCIF